MQVFDLSIFYTPSEQLFLKKKSDYKKIWRNNARRIFQISVQDFVRATCHRVLWVRDHFYAVKGVKDPPTQMQSTDIRGFNHFFGFLVSEKQLLVRSKF